MSFRTAYGYTHSENGWRMCNRDECVMVAGPYMDTAPIRQGAPAVILGDFARRYHREVAPLVSPVWGWSRDNDVATSNHLSGTALDFNAPQWPWGLKRMPQGLVGKTNRLLAFYEGVVFWGRNWSRPDEMHFQIGVPEGSPALARIVAKIQGGGEPRVFGALTDAEQAELARKVDYIAAQLGPNVWSAASSMGRDAQGREITVRDGLAKHIREA